MTGVRNAALAPLSEISDTQLGSRISTIVFLNDVVYHHTDVLSLLDAVDINRQSRADAPIVMACGLDMEVATLYDQWALRDRCGRAVNGLYPYFTAAEDRRQVAKGGLVEVGTCWNGIVAMRADPFMSPPRRYSADPSSSPILDESTPPLRFPEPPESCIISECTLLPISLLNSFHHDEITPRIVVDSQVLVAYDFKWWWFYSYFTRTPIVNLWISLFERPLLLIWQNFGFANFYRWSELKDACYPTNWLRCSTASEKFLSPPKYNPPLLPSTTDFDQGISLRAPKPVKSKSAMMKKKDIRMGDLLKKKEKYLVHMKEMFLKYQLF